MNSHLAVYKKLLEVISRVKQALRNDDLDTLQDLTGQHQLIMTALYRLGMIDDPNLLEPLRIIQQEMDEIVGLMADKRDLLHEKLASIYRKKRQAAAYQAVDQFG